MNRSIFESKKSLRILAQAFESTADDGSLICYYTAQCTEELNDRFGDILHQIKDMEVKSLFLLEFDVCCLVAEQPLCRIDLPGVSIQACSYPQHERLC